MRANAAIEWSCAGTLLTALLASATVTAACHAPEAKAACAVVEAACGFVSVRMPDGHVVQVPVTELQKTAAKLEAEHGH